MESSFTILRVRGITIGANWSWLLVFALVAWSLGSGLFPRTYPGLSDTSYVVMGLVTAVIFFASVLLHELGHAFRALKEGMQIDGITLWLFGGVARFKGMFPSAGAEFRIAIAGPIVSVLLAVAFGVVAWILNRVAAPEPVIGVADYLARINAILVAFNMVPALPLDGGRVLRSYLWHRQESFAAATLSAAKAGRAFAFVLIGVGLLGFITGAGIGGIWFAFLGWFLLQAVGAEASYAMLRQSLGGLRVRDLMTPQPETVTPDMSVQDFIEELAHARGHSTYPVVRDGDVMGLVSLRAAGAVPAGRREDALVSEVMAARSDVAAVRPDDDLFEAVAQMQGSAARRALVVEDGRLEGILSGSDVARALELAEVRGPSGGEAPRRSAGIAVWVVVALAIVAAAAFLYRPPVVVLEPGIALDVTRDIEIEGVEVDDVNGEYLLTSVSLGQPHALGLLWAVVQGDDVLPLNQVFPEGQDPQDYLREQRDIFRQSRMLAAAAAARALGMPVTVQGEGARVVAVFRGTPAADVLEQGDIVVAVDGQPIQTAQELSAAIRSRPAGTRFSLEIVRGGERRTVTVASAALPEVTEGGVGIGVSIVTEDFSFDLPFEITFEDRQIGGPSAGLAYALAIADLLDGGDYASGRSIAATGTIGVEGEVGRVGGLEAKARAAESEGAELFIVPEAEIDEAREANIAVRGVTTLEEAVALLTRTA